MVVGFGFGRRGVFSDELEWDVVESGVGFACRGSDIEGEGGDLLARLGRDVIEIKVVSFIGLLEFGQSFEIFFRKRNGLDLGLEEIFESRTLRHLEGELSLEFSLGRIGRFLKIFFDGIEVTLQLLLGFLVHKGRIGGLDAACLEGVWHREDVTIKDTLSIRKILSDVKKRVVSEVV